MNDGISCWPYGDRDACDRTIEQGDREPHDRFETRAGKEGWVIGHYDGQAFYCCPEHRNCVWDPSRLVGYQMHRPFKSRHRPNRLKSARGRRHGVRAFFRHQHGNLNRVLRWSKVLNRNHSPYRSRTAFRIAGDKP